MTRPRVLLAWEYGAGFGHSMRLARIARTLGPRFDAVLAAPDGAPAPDATSFRDAVSVERPQHFAQERRLPGRRRIASYADVLERLGFADAAFVAARVGLWERVMAHVRPDAVVADYAPALLLAARGRVPTIAVGNGYTLPPAELARYPIWLQGAPRVDQDVMLDAVNRGLDRAGRDALGTIPAIFRADRSRCMTLPVLDPFGRGGGELCGVEGAGHEAGGGDEVFAYLSDARRDRVGAVLEALRASGRRAIVVAPGLADSAASLATERIEVRSDMMGHEEIARRANMLVHGGGHDMMAFGALLGVPQVCFVLDLEKLLHARRLEQRGVCAMVPGTDASRLSEAIARASEASPAARELAVELKSWRDARPITRVASDVRELLDEAGTEPEAGNGAVGEI